jgi:GSH-dependent disulfide-bond oxidoreductase
MLGQLWYFKVFSPEKISLALERYEREAVRLFGVLNERLRDRGYLIGDYGIADTANFPWIDAFPQLGLTLDGHPNLKRWHQEIAKRPAVIRGLAVPNLTVLQTK